MSFFPSMSFSCFPAACVYDVDLSAEKLFLFLCCFSFFVFFFFILSPGYRDETDEAMDEVLDVLGIEDLTEEVFEEARRRDMLRKLKADRTDLAGDVKKLLRALLGRPSRGGVRRKDFLPRSSDPSLPSFSLAWSEDDRKRLSANNGRSHRQDTAKDAMKCAPLELSIFSVSSSTFPPFFESLTVVRLYQNHPPFFFTLFSFYQNFLIHLSSSLSFVSCSWLLASVSLHAFPCPSPPTAEEICTLHSPRSG